MKMSCTVVLKVSTIHWVVWLALLSSSESKGAAMASRKKFRTSRIFHQMMNWEAPSMKSVRARWNGKWTKAQSSWRAGGRWRCRIQS